jgi:hypothetical protein
MRSVSFVGNCSGHCLTLLATKSDVRRKRPRRIHDLVFRYRLSVLANRIFPKTTLTSSCAESKNDSPVGRHIGCEAPAKYV